MPRYANAGPVRVSTKVKDEVGNLIDPGSISLVLQKPDLTQQTYTTATTPAVVRNSVGDFTIVVNDQTQAGPYQYVWVTTGNGRGETPSGGFTLVQRFTPAHIFAEDVAARLNITATTDEIRDMIASAVSEQEQSVGAVAPRQVTDTVTAYGGRLWLPTRPVLSVVAATFAGSAVSVADWRLGPPMAGYVANMSSPLAGEYSVTYTAGRNPVPQDLVEAALLRVQASYDTQRGPAGLPLAAEQDSGFGSSYPLLLRAQAKEAPYVLPVVA